MKNYYTLLLLLSLSFTTTATSQVCNSLGCASNNETITTDGSLSNTFGGPGDCYDLFPYKQVFWQFFYSPFGGDFTQSFTPTGTGDPLDLDYVVFDMGTSGPPTASCPVDETGWPEVLCNYTASYGVPTGPGVDGTAPTVAGHFYAVAVIIWQGISTGGDASYTFDIGTPQIGGVDFTALNCPGVLPVKLSAFEATVKACNINLEWIAANESGFKNYQVEYSTDGTRFQPITSINANTGSGIQKKYTYLHNNPTQGNIYYRLKMIDADGRFDYSKTIALKLDCTGNTIFVYPNPVTDVLHINNTNAAKNVTTVNLYDNNGKLLYTGLLLRGTNVINMASFPKGIFLLRLSNELGVQNMKIIK